MKRRLPNFVDAGSIYAMAGMLGFAAYDYITIDQSKRASGLALLIGVLFILGARLLVRQQRQIDGLRGRLPGQKSAAKSVPQRAVAPVPPLPGRPYPVVELVRRH